MDLNAFKSSIETNVYHIPTGVEVPLHDHVAHDEIFHCIKGSGLGLLEDTKIKLTQGVSFTARAGKMHGLLSENDLHVVAIMIPVEKIICHCKQVSYGDIRKAMVNGARTIDDIKEITGAGTACGGCLGSIENILSVACGCNDVSMETVITAVKNGANTASGVSEITGAGGGCGKCKMLIQNVIDLQK